LHQNIALASGRGRWFIRAARERQAAGQLLGELRIKAAGLDQRVVYLSGGNQQKAVLAKWLYAGRACFCWMNPRAASMCGRRRRSTTWCGGLPAGARRSCWPPPNWKSFFVWRTASWCCIAGGRPGNNARGGHRGTNYAACHGRCPVSVAALLRRFGPLLGLVVLCAALGTLSDRFLTFDNLINVFRQSAVNALLALGHWW